MTPMPATPASGWQSSSIDVVDAIVLSPHSDNPTKSLTHAICLNLSAKLSAVLHRRSAPSYVCAGAGMSIRTEGRAPLTERNCSIQVPNEVPREGGRGRGNEMFNLNCQRIEQRETIKNSCSLIKKKEELE